MLALKRLQIGFRVVPPDKDVLLFDVHTTVEIVHLILSHSPTYTSVSHCQSNGRDGIGTVKGKFWKKLLHPIR